MSAYVALIEVITRCVHEWMIQMCRNKYSRHLITPTNVSVFIINFSCFFSSFIPFFVCKTKRDDDKRQHKRVATATIIDDNFRLGNFMKVHYYYFQLLLVHSSCISEPFEYIGNISMKVTFLEHKQ